MQKKHYPKSNQYLFEQPRDGFDMPITTSFVAMMLRAELHENLGIRFMIWDSYMDMQTNKRIGDS